ncbi:MAG TPA: DUF433 domain-containing protein [Stellaceae bacterium]|jgi:uncharacterized protein (DUF433 family)|nr:DUF433 domain-containing protein [Stellaceae bacterium]
MVTHFSAAGAGDNAPDNAKSGKHADVEPALDRITFEPGKMGGRACIRGLRITVGLIVSLVAQGAGWDEILRDYPDLEPEDIRQALTYAAWLAREEIVSA